MADSDSSTGPLESLVENKPWVATEQESHIMLEETNNATESLKKNGQLLVAELDASVRDKQLLREVSMTQSGEEHDPEENNVYITKDHSKNEKSCLSVKDSPSEAVGTQLPCKEHAPFISHSISETLKKAQHSTESLQTSVHSGWSTTSKETSVSELNNAIGAVSHDTPNLSGTDFIRREQSLPPSNSPLDLHSVTKGEDHQASVLNATQQVEHCVSSLVFIPRGLSQGPPGPVMEVHHGSSPTSITASTPDLAPDLEMDLYGISYSLDDAQH